VSSNHAAPHSPGHCDQYAPEQTFTCISCRRVVCYCEGGNGDDAYLDECCADCWSRITKAQEAWEATAPVVLHLTEDNHG
jgi:hypothetical protein